VKTSILSLLTLLCLLFAAGCSPKAERPADKTWRGNTGNGLVHVALWIGTNPGSARAPDRLEITTGGQTRTYLGAWSDKAGFTGSLTGLPPDFINAVTVVEPSDANTAILPESICGKAVEICRQK